MENSPQRQRRLINTAVLMLALLVSWTIAVISKLTVSGTAIITFVAAAIAPFISNEINNWRCRKNK